MIAALQGASGAHALAKGAVHSPALFFPSLPPQLRSGAFDTDMRVGICSPDQVLPCDSRKGDSVLDKLEIRTSVHSCLIDITARIDRVVGQHRIEEGICHIFVPHTTAGLTINENADPTVPSDLLAELDKTVPWEDGYSHSEGNSAAHIKASLMGSSLTVFVSRGRLQLGTWQGVFLAEFDGPRTRQVWIKILAG